MVHDVNTRTFFLQTRRLESRRMGQARQETPEHFRLDDRGLFWALPVDGTKIEYMQAYVLADLPLQIVRFDWKSHVRPEEKIDYYLDIVDMAERSSTCWHVRDLYLDITVLEGKWARVLDTDEYLAALAEGYLEPGEAEHALEVTHTTLNALAAHGYRLEAYLASQGIHLEWV